MSERSVVGLVEELMEWGASDLDDRVRELELERGRVEAEVAATVGEIDRRQSYLDDGHRSVKAYLRASCNVSDAEAARVGRLTAAAADVPGLAGALHEGRIGTPEANELAVAHANQRVRERLREFRTCVQRFVMLADLDGAHRDLDGSIQNRRVRVVDLNGSLCLDGGGGDPLVNVEHGDQADEHPLARTVTQRSYDAFVAIMRGALANHQADRPTATAEPLVNILIDHHTWGRLLAGVECGGHNRLKHRKRWRTRHEIHGRIHTIDTTRGGTRHRRLGRLQVTTPPASAQP